MAKRLEPTDDEVGTIEEQEQRIKLLRAAQASAFKDRAWQSVATLDVRIGEARERLQRSKSALRRAEEPSPQGGSEDQPPGHPRPSSALDPRRSRALDLRMAGMSWRAIADRLNEEGARVARETVRGWSLSDEWAEEYSARRHEIDRATQQAQVGLVELAWDAQRKVLTDPDASDADRLRASELVLKHLGPAVKSEVAVSATEGASDEELMARIRRAMEGR